MSKILEATCEDGIVTALGVEVQDVEILSEGVGASSGVLILDGDKAYYVAKTSPDLKTTLEKLSDALGSISSALSAIDGAGHLIAATAGVPGPPVASGDISSLNSSKGELDDLLEELK